MVFYITQTRKLGYYAIRPSLLRWFALFFIEPTAEQ